LAAAKANAGQSRADGDRVNTTQVNFDGKLAASAWPSWRRWIRRIELIDPRQALADQAAITVSCRRTPENSRLTSTTSK